MMRMLTAAAIVALFAAPVLAQDVTGRSQGQSTIDQGSSTSDSMSSQGTQADQYQSEQSTGLRPADCLPNDARPECQTAALPEAEDVIPEDQVGQSPGAASPEAAPTSPTERAPSQSESAPAPSAPSGGTQ